MDTVNRPPYLGSSGICVHYHDIYLRNSLTEIPKICHKLSQQCMIRFWWSEIKFQRHRDVNLLKNLSQNSRINLPLMAKLVEVDLILIFVNTELQVTVIASSVHALYRHTVNYMSLDGHGCKL